MSITTSPAIPISRANPSEISDAGDSARQKAIGEYLFSIAPTDRPDAARRWGLVVEHIAAWLLDEWEHEQRAEH